MRERIVRLKQVQVPEADPLAQLFLHPKLSLELAVAALKIPPEQFRADWRQLFRVVNGLPGPVEDACRNVRGVNRPFSVQPEKFRQHDGQRVGFLAGRGCRAPGAKFIAFVMAQPPGRQQHRPHPVEMFFLAEEMGVVRGNDVNEITQLLRAFRCFKPLAILVEAADFEGAQALGHAGADERAFVVAEIDAAVFVNQPAQKFVIGIRQRVGCER